MAYLTPFVSDAGYGSNDENTSRFWNDELPVILTALLFAAAMATAASEPRIVSPNHDASPAIVVSQPLFPAK